LAHIHDRRSPKPFLKEKGDQFMEWYIKVIQNYVGFQGRARRKEYWTFVVISFVVSVILEVIQRVLHLGQILTSLYSLAVLLPSIAVSMRRLHDTGRTGWWILIGLIPIIGTIILLVYMFLDSQEGENKYGPNPKLIE
jgi:uncharacterized membrane protein YhaH (DUF805 family)